MMINLPESCYDYRFDNYEEEGNSQDYMDEMEDRRREDAE